VTASEWTEGAALEGLLPHRGLNMLIDAFRSISVGDQQVGQARLTVRPDDAVGRGIFLRSSSSGPVVIECALAEYLALCAICVLRPEMADDEIAFFSVISDFERVREARAGEVLNGEVKRLRDKGRFRRFEGSVRGDDGSPIATAEIMAYTASATESAQDRRESTRLLRPPKVSISRPVDRSSFAWKRPEMLFVDDVIDIAPDLSEATLRYTYPPDHPFCRGHFPGNPVMMGITQWIAAADAASWLAIERARAGAPAACDGRWQADVDIVRESGSPVAEMKQMSLAAASDGHGGLPAAIHQTRRVGFRDQVRPGESLYIRARVSAHE
jgi:3-hydroxymyristoyl/3-hydroxydecanoyl-(acyl carrier protein) dehydratase